VGSLRQNIKAIGGVAKVHEAKVHGTFTPVRQCLRLRGLSPATAQSLRFLGTLRFVTILPSSQPPLLHGFRRACGDCSRCHTN